ncbi:MAG: TIR domain-containing protein, partial [Acidobacteriota bacterium]
MKKPTVFISYSHKDKDWLDILRTHLKPFVRNEKIIPWHDTQIRTGAKWLEEIRKALQAADAAILLVSPNFLASDFIAENELPPLLKAARSGGLTIYWIAVTASAYKETEIAEYQCANDPAQPLDSLTPAQQSQLLVEVCRKICNPHEHPPSGGTTSSPEGMVPKVAPSRLPISGEFLIGREKELKRLDQAWTEPRTNLISIVAWGGVGKTALILHWLGQMAADAYRGAEKVFDWTFYSQGTRQEQATSADQFIDRALSFFGDKDPTQGGPYEKGERLARLVTQSRTLLILDGLEPLQHPPGLLEGRLKDSALESLIRGLSLQNPGLCILTTREPVAEVAHLSSTTAPRVDLEQLSTQAGAQLLKKLQVKGTDPELQQASQAFAGHALALTLLGTYLSEVHDGDVRHWKEVPLLD